LALYYNAALGIGADVRVVPAKLWRRDVWYDRTGLPWIRPSPNMPSLQSALLYPGLVAFEGTNLSVGRGTPEAFQRIGAPWLKADSVVALLEGLDLRGLRFVADDFQPKEPTDKKYSGQRIRGIRIEITSRNAVHSGRLGAALLWAIARSSPADLRLDTTSFDLRFGSPEARRALMRGDDPDRVIDATYPSVSEFRERARIYHLYR
jgi:uncharacterized protein YbbC (DUF1343 family)